MAGAPIILVPGFWLGAWAWDEVAAHLRDEGREVVALTLPGLESAEAAREGIGLADHVRSIVAAITAHDEPVVLVVHSAAGFSGYAASDRVPDRIVAVVYVDTAPGVGPMDATFTGAERPLAWDELVAEENLDGLDEGHRERFRERAVPVPGGVIRDAHPFADAARRDIPSTIISTSFPAEQLRAAAEEHPEWTFLAGISELRDLTWVDLPTGHWPMWSRPRELADLIRTVPDGAPSTAG
jgi:pimeloyl-ACP methyl ester carboxylesterase